MCAAWQLEDCSHEGCTKNAQKTGFCVQHDAKVNTYSQEGRTNQVDEMGASTSSLPAIDSDTSPRLPPNANVHSTKTCRERRLEESLYNDDEMCEQNHNISGVENQDHDIGLVASPYGGSIDRRIDTITNSSSLATSDDDDTPEQRPLKRHKSRPAADGDENYCDVSEEMKIMAENAATYNSDDTFHDNGANDNMFEDENTQTGGAGVEKDHRKKHSSSPEQHKQAVEMVGRSVPEGGATVPRDGGGGLGHHCPALNEGVMLMLLLQEKNELVQKLKDANTKLKNFEYERELYIAKQVSMKKYMNAMETKHGETVDKFAKEMESLKAKTLESVSERRLSKSELCLESLMHSSSRRDLLIASHREELKSANEMHEIQSSEIKTLKCKVEQLDREKQGITRNFQTAAQENDRMEEEIDGVFNEKQVVEEQLARSEQSVLSLRHHVSYLHGHVALVQSRCICGEIRAVCRR
mmetsp:Transcript_30526/g.64629  ORF Transcript_30526/g.64629 Transcript_30526/m.64629 type:complete len:468 (+) Transcript_30526:204-1607(+)